MGVYLFDRDGPSPSLLPHPSLPSCTPLWSRTHRWVETRLFSPITDTNWIKTLIINIDLGFMRIWPLIYCTWTLNCSLILRCLCFWSADTFLFLHWLKWFCCDGRLWTPELRMKNGWGECSCSLAGLCGCWTGQLDQTAGRAGEEGGWAGEEGAGDAEPEQSIEHWRWAPARGYASDAPPRWWFECLFS